MEETIKNIEVIAYKGMNSDMTCGYFQYEIRKTYKTDKSEFWKYGFHACLNPLDVLDYYKQTESSRYFKVLLSGEITKCDEFDTEVVATEITILEEINIDEIINNTEWWKNENVLDLLYFSDGFARVQRSDRKYNYIDKQGKLLSEQWFENVFNFHEGFAVVQRVVDEKYNFIDKDGKYLTDEWFYWIDIFNNGFARVQRGNELYNLITENGKILSDEWFYWVEDFENGFARVQRGNELYNLITENGKILSDEWFYWIDIFNNGFARVQRTNGECCKIDKSGKLYKD